ncbi:sugar ABC transporter [Sorangium cellulosum]|uniref:Sugar ABC transporter n=1 Tax=Sorangium cellulosum TaxID=56 RepID=A0A4P2PVK9_SORCE|nr:substrate-binding domain-containing protein [Sorangium cellulosum]AUX20680.1 sugar ABC transporter [Sorangium cellulosum]
MTRTGRCWVAAFGLALMTTACGASPGAHAGGDATGGGAGGSGGGAGGSGGGAEATPIQRTPTPQTEFTPVELEATIDNLVAEINRSSLGPMHMAVMLKTFTASDALIAVGANRAMREIGVTGNMVGAVESTGDPQEAIELQVQQIEQAVTAGAEGIGVSPFGDASAAAIDEAVAKGVHVVTLDTDTASSSRALHVGILDSAAGVRAAETLLPMLPPAPGTVMIHGSVDPAWVGGEERTQGAQGALEAAGYTVQVRSVDRSDEGETSDVAWMRSQIEAADPPVVGLLGLFDLSYRCAMAAEAAGKPDLPIVAFDFDPKTVDSMRQGRIQATHTQRQYYEGYLVPYILYGIKTLGLDATREILAPLMGQGDAERVDLGIDVVPADKIDAYADFLEKIRAIQ